MSNNNAHDAVIVAAARTAIGKAKRGSLATFRPDEMAAIVIQELLRRAEGLDPAEIDDVILGCAFPEGEQGMNMIMAGQAQVVIAGGTESMTMVPMTGFKFSPLPYLAENMPEAFTSMGLTAENVAAKYGIHREEQDAFSLRSHQRAAEAVDSGRFDPEIVPLDVEVVEQTTPSI
jgi:acetyl-CoA acyltransferase